MNAKEAALLTDEKNKILAQKKKDDLDKWVQTIFPRRLAVIMGQIEQAINEGRYSENILSDETAEQMSYVVQYFRNLGYEVELFSNFYSVIHTQNLYHIAW